AHSMREKACLPAKVAQNLDQVCEELCWNFDGDCIESVDCIWLTGLDPVSSSIWLQMCWNYISTQQYLTFLHKVWEVISSANAFKSTSNFLFYEV
ncbi:hypothetical protein STEG23_030049, partial [Scotinomys teguina]